MSKQMMENKNRRLISGSRVLCPCSLDLPKLDPFSAFKASRKGIIAINVRGGSLYLNEQLTEAHARNIFPADTKSTIRNFILYPPDNPEIRLGEIHVRYLRLTDAAKLSGLILRFVGLSENQLDQLNNLLTLCPTFEGDEEQAVLQHRWAS